MSLYLHKTKVSMFNFWAFIFGQLSLNLCWILHLKIVQISSTAFRSWQKRKGPFVYFVQKRKGHFSFNFFVLLKLLLAKVYESGQTTLLMSPHFAILILSPFLLIPFGQNLFCALFFSIIYIAWRNQGIFFYLKTVE